MKALIPNIGMTDVGSNPTGYKATELVMNSADVDRMVAMMHSGSLKPWLLQLQARFPEHRVVSVGTHNMDQYLNAARAMEALAATMRAEGWVQGEGAAWDCWEMPET